MRPIDRAWRSARRAAFRKALGCALASALAIAPARAGDVQEYEVKAAYLFNFARFAEWPVSKDDRNLQLCLIGRDDFGGSLAALEGKSVQSRTLRVRRVLLEEIDGCHILFVSESERRRLAMILSMTETQSVLTVSDIDGFAEKGGMVGLQLVDQRVQFDVNLGALYSANIKLPAQVLKLARLILNPRGRP